MNIYERLKRIAKNEPNCFIGERCSMHEVAHDALIELAAKDEVIKMLKRDLKHYQRHFKRL